MSNDEMKQAVKEAAKEWIDEQFKVLGKWTARSLGVLFFGTLVYVFFNFLVK